MNAAEWISFLKQLPTQEHEHLLLTTSCGIELALQGVLQFHDTYMLVRGRLGGTTEAGKTFCLPYDNLSHVQFIRDMTLERLTELFGPLLLKTEQKPPVEAKATAPVEAPAAPAAEAEPQPEAVKPPAPPAPEAAPPAADAARAAHTALSLREKLRARLAAARGDAAAQGQK